MSDTPTKKKSTSFTAPEFYKPLTDLSSPQGECIVLECRVKGAPPPEVTWQREGHVIEDSLDFRILHKGEIATLVIGEVYPEDTGIFTCEATNEAGTARTSCKITIKGSGYNSISTKTAAASAQRFQQPRPTQVLPSTHHNADENHNFKVEKDQLVQEVANMVSSPQQQKQGKQDVQGDYILYSPTLAAILEIEPQEYKVSTFEQRLMSEIEYRLERTPPVNEDPEDGIFEDVPMKEQIAPTFTTRLKNFKAMDGTSTKFLCRVTAKPRAKVYWFKDGKQISKRSQHYLQRNDGEGGHELYIPHLCMEDDGNYTALATNPQGRASSTGRLAMVSERGFSNDVKSQANAIPKQSITSPRLTSPLSPTARMVLPDVTSPDVPSAQATSSRTTSLSVASPVSPSSGAFTLPPKGELAADEESPVEKYYRPTFIQKPAVDTHADEGKLVRFDVKVTGLPTPVIEWLINGRPVIQDALHKILVRENNVHSLLFDRVSRMDEGQYTITASNKAGSAVTHVQLHVAPREQMTAPAFVQRLTGQCVAEGDSIRLEARVVATPRPIISWKRGSDQVVPSGRIQLYEDDSGYVCLQITQAHASDAAWYTCSATNKAGISSCNCKLDVYSPTANVPSNRRRIRTPHRYANLAKVAGVDMREALTPDAQTQHMLPESEEL